MSRWLLPAVMSQQTGFDWNVQRGEVSISGGNQTSVVSLVAPVPVGESFATIICQGADTRRERIMAMAVLQTVVGGNYTELRIDRGVETISNMSYAWQVVTSPAISVQMVERIDTAEGQTTDNATIDSVDLAKTFIVETSAPNGNGDRTSAYRYELTTSTNLRVQKNIAFSESVFRYCAYVISIPAASVTRGTVNLTGTSVDVSLSAQDNTFCMWSNTINTSTNVNDAPRNAVQGRWIDNTTFRFERNDSSDTVAIAYEFVTIPGTSLQRVDMDSSSQVINQSITSVDLSKAVIFVNSIGNMRSSETSPRACTHHLSSATNLQIDRNTDTGTFNVSSQIVSI